MQMTAAAAWLNTTFAAYDEAISLAVHKLFQLNSAFFSPFFEFITFFGDGGIPLIIIAACLLFFKRTRHIGVAMLLGLAIGALFTNVTLKPYIARPRPYTDESNVLYQIWLLAGQHIESDRSFPSGHTTAAFGAMTALFFVTDKRRSWPVFIFAVLMGVSRIYLGVHYPSDVLGGIICGFTGGAIAAFIVSRIPWLYPLRLLGVDKKYIGDAEHVSDYKSAPAIGRVSLGELCLYYRDLGKKYYVPYEYIDRAFCRISECQPDDSPAYYYYRLILVHGEQEFANLIFNEEADVDKLLELIKERNPNMALGYVPPADGKRRHFS